MRTLAWHRHKFVRRPIHLAPCCPSFSLPLLFLFRAPRTVAAQTHKSSGHRIGSRLDIFHRAMARFRPAMAATPLASLSLSPSHRFPFERSVRKLATYRNSIEDSKSVIRARVTRATLRDREKGGGTVGTDARRHGPSLTC